MSRTVVVEVVGLSCVLDALETEIAPAPMITAQRNAVAMLPPCFLTLSVEKDMVGSFRRAVVVVFSTAHNTTTQH
jgi:hypothetical protein